MNLKQKSELTFREAWQSHQKGFSLLEILIALALVALMGTFVAGKIFDQFEEGRRDSAKIQMQSLEGRLKEFRRHCHFYPTTDQGLDALINKPSGGKECKRYRAGGYIESGEIPLDPWDEEFNYDSDGKKFVLFTGGPDLEPGTADDIYLYKKDKPASGEGEDE